MNDQKFCSDKIHCSCFILGFKRLSDSMPKGIRCQIGGPLKAIVLMSYFMTDLEARILKSS